MAEPMSLMDRVHTHLAELMEATSKALETSLGTQPPGTAERPWKERIAQYQALTEGDMAALVSEFGPAAVNRYIYQMEHKLRAKR